MIIICDILCKGISHEKVNSGFISGLRLAFPAEKIIFYADPTHIEAIKKILQHDKIEIRQIEYKALQVKQSSFLFNIFNLYFGLSGLLSDVVSFGASKVFFLSFDVGALFVVKKIKEQSRFAHLKFAFVLHGAFESIAIVGERPKSIVLPRNSIPSVTILGAMEKIRRFGLINIPRLLLYRLLNKLPRMPLPRRLADFFLLKNVMEWKHNSDYRFISLSPHITANTAEYLDTNKLNFHTVILPTNFVTFAPAPHNGYPKFAVFGYGDSLVLHNIAYALSERQIIKPYEIRIIGMDNRGTEGFANITCTSPGRPLDRREMEKQAEDIDVFLILYDKTKYRLSCSGSILEALSLSKPIIHFDNECINYFNKLDSPIGFRCFSFEEYVDRLVDVIESYEKYQYEFVVFRKNIHQRRLECSIESSVPALRASFEW